MSRIHLHRMKILDDSSQTVTSKEMYDRHIPALFQNRVPFEMMKVHFVTKQYGNIFSFTLLKRLAKKWARMPIVK